MPSDLNLSHPSDFAAGPSYRPQRRNRGAGRRALLVGGGAAALLAAGAAFWNLTRGEPPPPPVIEADLRPVRVRPVNPGGMQVAGADEPAPGPANARRDRLTPAAETPAPLALRAQLGGAQPGGAPLGAERPAPEAAEALAAPVPPRPPISSEPAPAAVPPAPPPSPPAAPSGAAVQLAAVSSEQVAVQEWRRLSKRMPELLGDRTPVIQRLERDGRTIWRLRTGGFADTAEATSFCVRLRAKGLACTIGSF